VFEVDHRPEPWELRDVTADLVAAGHQALTTAISEREELEGRAREQLLRQMRGRADSGKPPLTKTEAELLLRAHGLKQKAARDMVAAGAGRLWQFLSGAAQGGKGGSAVYVVLGSGSLCEATPTTGIGTSESPRQTTLSEGGVPVDRINTGQREPEPSNPSIHAGSSATEFPSSPRNLPPVENRDGNQNNPQPRKEWVE
jgi:hypothetical protein